eukprot:6239308-Prymnesium_polylepis.1
MTVLPCVTIVLGYLAFPHPSECTGATVNGTAADTIDYVDAAECAALNGTFTPGGALIDGWDLPTLTHRYVASQLEPHIVIAPNVTALTDALLADGAGSAVEFGMAVSSR